MSCKNAPGIDAEVADLCCAMMQTLHKAFSLVDLESSSRNHLQRRQHCLAKSLGQKKVGKQQLV